MALIVITVQDEDEGGVEFKMLAEPPIPNQEGDELTTAQMVGRQLMLAIVEEFSTVTGG